MLCKTYNNGKLSVQNHYLRTPLRHIGVNCSSAQTDVTGDPLWQLDNTLKETEPLCRLDMHSDTTIEEHHHFKVFCYIILVYNGRHFEFVGNFRSRMRFHNISYAVVLILLVNFFLYLFTKKNYIFFRFEKGFTVLKWGGGGMLLAAICASHKKIRR